MTEERLSERIQSPGYTPRAKEIPDLVELLAVPDEETARNAERALARAGRRAATVAAARFASATGPLRPRLVDVVARVAADVPSPELETWVLERIRDADERTRRRAIIASGKLGLAAAEGALADLFAVSGLPAEKKAIAMALSKVGSERARVVLERMPPSDAETDRVVREARLLLDRRRVRSSPNSIRGTEPFPEPLRVLLHVRAGLEEILATELGPGGSPRTRGRGRVEVVSSGPLSVLHSARTFLHLGFPLPPESVIEGDVVSAVARALAGDTAFRILSTLTEGPVRYRMDWADAGRSRSKTLRVAERVAELRPSLLNDPTDAPWEAVISVRSAPAERVFVELWPRAYEDPRFRYRKRTVPASSHPTIAAALAHVAGVAVNDIVWDPFVGAGLELVERAQLGPCRSLLGTDVDPGALAAADENLRAAGLGGARLELGDATRYAPEARPTLIITNPPYGQRVLRREAVPPLLGRFLEHASRRLSVGGRLVWVSPVPDHTAREGKKAGLRLTKRLPVDLGGPSGEIQRFEKH